jgi:DNA adenine methylase
MIYMGSKQRIAKEILPIMLKDRDNRLYIEPFAGGMNIIDHVNGNRVANDVNPYLISMWKALVEDNYQPENITKEIYADVRDNKDKYPAHFVGWVGFACSFRGKFFGGFAGQIKTKVGTIRDYQEESTRNARKQLEKLKGVTFSNKPFLELEIPDNSIVYCDPPYEGTTKYANDFDHKVFWEWVRAISKKNRVFVSEYNAPSDFNLLWEKQLSSSLSTNGKTGGNRISVEKLFSL